MIDLNGKVALVTGSSRGIGRGCVLEMARLGADVTINYRSHADEAEEVAEEVRELGQRALVVGADVSDRQAVEEMVAQTAAELGHLDILISNAYYSKREPFLEMSVEGMEKTLGVTLIGGFHAAQTAARQMVAQGTGGSILFISSVLSFLPMPTSLSYNTAKSGMTQMMRTMAVELAKHRIRVNVLEPGWIDTPGERQFMTDEEIQEGGKKILWGRVGYIEDIGKPAAFLSSDAADYITGSVLKVDGGYSLQRYDS